MAAIPSKKPVKGLDELIAEYDKLYEVDFTFNPPSYPLVDGRLIREIEGTVIRMQDGCPICKKFPSNPECLTCHGKGGQALDWWTIIVGPEGSGKSTFAVDYIYEYCKAVERITGLEVDFVATAKKFTIFDDFDLMRVIFKINPRLDRYQFIFGDEGANIFLNRESVSRTRRMAVKFMNVMRFLRCFVVVCTVDLSQLDVILREHRIKSLVRIAKQGEYHYYSRSRISTLFSRNSGRKSLTWNWRGIPPDFMGRYKFSPEIKDLIEALKLNYSERFRMEAKRQYYAELIKRLDLQERIDSSTAVGGSVEPRKADKPKDMDYDDEGDDDAFESEKE